MVARVAGVPPALVRGAGVAEWGAPPAGGGGAKPAHAVDPGVGELLVHLVLARLRVLERQRHPARALVDRQRPGGARGRAAEREREHHPDGQQNDRRREGKTPTGLATAPVVTEPRSPRLAKALCKLTLDRLTEPGAGGLGRLRGWAAYVGPVITK